VIKNQKILFVGCGKMGGALLSGIIKASLKTSNILVIDPNMAPASKELNVQSISKFEQKTIEEFAPNIIFLAVKPQIIEKILPLYKPFVMTSLFISIIAGKTTEFFEKHLGENVAIVRTMPNLPILIGEGVSGIFANNNVSSEQKKASNSFFAFDKNIALWVENEADLNAVTAISGSGPAYLFHFIECLTEAGIKLGLSKEISEKLAANTVSGSASLAVQSDKSASELRENVTSPNGTTQAALNELMGSKELQKVVNKATKAAFDRSKELSD